MGRLCGQRTVSRCVTISTGKRVLITGVSRGLGRDLMLRCLEGGAEVIGVVRNNASRDQLRTQIPAQARATLVVADLATPGAIVAALNGAQIDAASIEMVILSAAIKHDGKSVLSLHELRETFQVNIFAAAELTEWLCAASGNDSDHVAPWRRRRATRFALCQPPLVSYWCRAWAAGMACIFRPDTMLRNQP